MYWHDEVKMKLKSKNQILFAKDGAFLQDLSTLSKGVNHRVLTLWALELAGESADMLKLKYPAETRPAEAVLAAKDWAAGRMKMRAAQRKILDCHAFAKEIDGKEDIATCHAIGQACAVVHTAGHAMGYPIYDLTAIVHRYGIDQCIEPVERRKQEYLDRLLAWNSYFREYDGQWADFYASVGENYDG